MEELRYWFMLPIAGLTAIAANQSGIGGAAIFGPVFIILFPLLGPDYPLSSPAAAVSTAIFVEIFGFSSGVLGYARRGLIDVRLVFKTAVCSVPLTILSSLFIHIPVLGLKILYTLIMFGVSGFFFYLSLLTDHEQQDVIVDDIPPTANPLSSYGLEMHEPRDAEAQKGDHTSQQQQQQQQPFPRPLCDPQGQITFRTLTERQGDPPKVHRYVVLPFFDAISMFLSASGGILTALVGVGLGEITVPRFQSFKVPVEVSSAASASAVALTCLSAATVQFVGLIRAGGMSAVPWNLIAWMVPGVMVGAQIGTFYAGRVPKALMQRMIGIFFGLIAILFLGVIIKSET